MITDALLAAGTVGTIAFVAIFVVDGATRPGYRPTYHAVSALALGQRGWIQTTNFVASGTLIALSSIGVHRAGANAILAVVIAVFGLGLVASGVFQMDPMRGYPPGAAPGTPTTTSRRHQLHDHAGLIVFGSPPVATLIAALTLDSTAWVVYSALTAVTSLVTFLAFGVAWEHDHPYTGLIQRVTIVIGWTWLAATCWHLTA